MSEERARELTALEPPPSIERIVRFFTELGERISTAGVTDEQGGPGDVGRKAAAFAQGVAGSGSDMGQTLSHWFTVLMDRYQVRVVDLPEFSLWLAKWYDIRSRTDAIVIHDDADQAPAWGRNVGRAALVAAVPLASAGAALASPSPMPPPPQTPVSPADAAPSRAFVLHRAPSAAQPALDDSAADGSVRPATDGSVRPASTPRSSWQETGRAGGTAPPDTPARTTGRSRRLTAGQDPSDSPSATTDESDAPAPRGPSSVVKRRLWTTNLAMGSMLTGSLLQSSQAASADPNALIVGGGPVGPSSGLGGPQAFGQPALHPPFQPGALPLASPLSADPTAGPAPMGPSVFSSPAQSFVGPAGAPSVRGYMHAPGASAPSAPENAHGTAGPAARPDSPAPGSESAPPGASPALPASQGGLSAQSFAAKQAGQFLPAVQEGGANARPGMAGPLALARTPGLAGRAVGAAAFGAAALAANGMVAGASPALSASQAGLSAQSFAAKQAGQFLPAVQEGGASAGPGMAGVGAGPGMAGPLALARTPGLVGGTAGLAASGVDGSGPVFGFTGSSPVNLLSGAGTAPKALTLSHGPAHQPSAPGKAPIPARPEMGQITLVAPPMQVASEQAEQGGLATAFDWTNLARGAGALDAGGLARLKQALPPGAQAIYPALPPGSLSAGAVNLALAPSLLGPLLHQGYGAGAAGMAGKVGGMASAAIGGSPTAAPLIARIIPGKKPMGDGAGLGHDQAHQQAGPAGALGQAGQASATRGGVLDFLGMPVRLAPSLSGKPELKDEVAVRAGAQAAPGQVVRPNQFASLRSGLFPGSGSVTAEPDQQAWAKAAPHFGLRDDKPTTLLAPDARLPLSRSLSSLAPAANPSAPPPPPRGPAFAPRGLMPGARVGGANAPMSSLLGSATHAPMSSLLGGATHAPVSPSLSGSAPGGRAAPALAMRPPSLLIGPGQAVPMYAPSSAAPGSPSIAGMPAPFAHSSGFNAAPPSAGAGTSAFAPPAPPLPAALSRFSPGAAPGGPSAAAPLSFAPSGVAPSMRPVGLPGLSQPSVGSAGSIPRSTSAAPWASASPNLTRPSVGSPGLLGRAFSPGRPGGQSLLTPGGRAFGSAGSGGSFLPSRPSAGATPGSAAFGGPTLRSAALPTLSAPSLPGMAPLRLPSAAATPSLGTLARSAPLVSSSTSLSLGQPSRLPLASSMPMLPSASHAPSIIVERAPQMPLAPPSPLAGRAARPDADTTMVIQRAVSGMPTPAARSGGATAAREGNPGAANAEGGANEVNLLANEVWSLLKRRISWEADRRGRW